MPAGLNDGPYTISAMGGTVFSITNATAAYILKVLGNATFTGDALQIVPVVGQTGNLLVITDTAGNRIFTLDVNGAITTTAAVKARETVLAVATVGANAITIPAFSQTIDITAAGVSAMTLANPTATVHDGVRLTFLSTTANAHTLSNAAGAGFNGGGAATDVGTFGGAKGDNIIVEAYQGVWYVVSKTNVTLA